MRTARTAFIVALFAALAEAAPGQAAFDPAVEAKNFSKTQERQRIYDTPEYQARLRTISQTNFTNALAMQAKDPEREFVSDLCWNGGDGCAGDVRLYDWQANGYGIVEPVLFTARNGATLSGHVWATKSGPAQRPGVVITNGSVQADEQLYWFAAQALAKAGYVVLTWDPQGQGQSDTRGEAPDQDEGFPAQSDGRPFFDGTEDALNFFFSTPSRPYVPESSCSTGTSHAAKQTRRVQAGLDAGFNPYWQLFDHQHVGLAGHSYGAAGVSYIGQWDPRVDAIVAWDNLSQPSPGHGGGESFPPGEKECPAHPEDRTDLTKDIAANAKRAKPALGMSGDYFLPPTPNTAEPRSPQQCKDIETAYERDGRVPTKDEGLDCKSFVSDEYSRFGIDTGELVIRGGTHLDFDWIPNHAFGATLRGADLIDWYTTAWFDKYVKHDPAADARLLTGRWRHDVREGEVDPDGDPNMFSFYHRSRLDITRQDGSRFTCEDLRNGCPGLAAEDGYPGEYDFASIVRSADGAAAPAAPAPGNASPARRCASRRAIVVRVRRFKGARVVRVVATTHKRTVGRARGRRIVVRLRGLPSGRFTIRLKVTLRKHGRLRHVVLTRHYRTCRAKHG